MKAERIFLETDDRGQLTGLPTLPARRQVEAILIVLPNNSEGEVSVTHRRPPPEFAGKMKVFGDLTEPVLPADDWEAGR
jgi:hypothetical protein